MQKVRSRKFNWTRKSCAQMFQDRADDALRLQRE